MKRRNKNKTRCPKCRSTALYKRSRAHHCKSAKAIAKNGDDDRKKPYRCTACKHEFDEPIID